MANVVMVVLLCGPWLLLLVGLAIPVEKTAIGRRIADGMLARMFGPHGGER